MTHFMKYITEMETPRKERLSILAVLILNALILCYAYTYFIHYGMYLGPIPWDDISFLEKSYQTLTTLWESKNFTGICKALFSLNMRTPVSDGVSFLGQMLAPNAWGVHFLLAVLLTIPVIAVLLHEKVKFIHVLLFIIMTPMYLKCFEYIKSDILGGIFIASLYFCLLLPKRPRRDSLYWLYAMIGSIFIVSKMTNPFNTCFYLAVTPCILFLNFFIERDRNISSKLKSLALEFYKTKKKEIVFLILIPLLIYIFFFLFNFNIIVQYIYSVIKSNSYWQDDRSLYLLIKQGFFAFYHHNTLPIVGPKIFGATPLMATFVFIMALFNFKKQYPAIILYLLGVLHILAVGILSPVYNATFAGPGYGLFLFTVLAYFTNMTHKTWIVVLTVFLFSYSMLSGDLNVWRKSSVRGAGIYEYQRFVDDMRKLTLRNNIKKITFSGNDPDMPPPNISYLLLKDNYEVTIETVAVENSFKRYVDWAEMVVLVENNKHQWCGYVPSCRKSRELAERVRKNYQFSRKSGPYYFTNTTYTILIK